MSPSASEEDVVVGRITGAWGLRGDVKVEVLTDFTERFSQGNVVYLEAEPTRIERSRSVRGGILVKLTVVRDRTRAESLRGRFLTIPSHEVATLPEGSYYHFQVIGMGVWTEQDAYLGELKEILTTGSNDVYVVRDGEQAELLIPALADVVLDVNLRKNRMTVRLPPGL